MEKQPLQTMKKTYTTTERAVKIYDLVVNVFDYNKSSDTVTPLGLVESQVDWVISKNLDATYLVPGAGIGTYVSVLISKGVNPSNIYAVEINPAYYELGDGIFKRFGVNYIHSDFLTWQPNMQFDVVIGNPPYQGPKLGKCIYQSLWPLFWAKSFSLLKPGGVVSLITPLTWCSPTSDLAKKDAIGGETRLWEVFEKYSTIADVTTIKKYFPGVGSTFSAVTVDTSGDSGLTFTNGYNPEFGFCPLSGAEEVEKQLSLTNNISLNHTISAKITPGVRVSLFRTRKINEVNVEVCQSMELPKTNANITLYEHVYCKDTEEAEYIRRRIIECADVLYKHCRYSGFMDSKVLGMISIDR